MWPSLSKAKPKQKTDVVREAAGSNGTSKETAKDASPDKSWNKSGNYELATTSPNESWQKTGDYEVAITWHSSESWGAEVALSVEEGDLVTIDLVDSQGWAHAAMNGNKQGWLPYAVLRRVIHVAKTYFSEGTYKDYLLLKPNDKVVVYSQQQDGERLWCYGGLLKAGTDIVEQVGWFSSETIGLKLTPSDLMLEGGSLDDVLQ